MLTVDDYGAIRRAHRDGMPIKRIALEFEHSRNTIRKVLKHPEPNPIPRERNRTASVLGAFQSIIDQILSDDEEEAPLKQRLEPSQKFADMVEAHWDGVEAYCHVENKVPWGFVEGLNHKIRALQRRAYGYRDEEYFRLKILTCMLPKL